MSRRHTAWPTPTSTIYSTTGDPFLTHRDISVENASLGQERDGSYFGTMDQRSYKELKNLINKIRQPLRPTSMKQGHVYAATTPWKKQSMVKIGFSGDYVEERLRSIPKKCKLPILQASISRKFQGAHRVEQLVHKFLQSDCHIRFNCKCGKKNKEWFKARLDVIMNLVGILRLWMQRQPYDFNTGFLKPEWSAALTSLERSLSTQNPYTILDFLVYRPVTRVSLPLGSTTTASTSFSHEHSVPNTSSPIRCSRRTRGCNVSSHRKETSSSLDRRRSASQTRSHERSRSIGATNHPSRRLDAGDDTEAQSYLSQIIWWLHAVLVWAMSYKLGQPHEVGHIPGQWELDFDRIDLNNSSFDSSELRSSIDRSSPSSIVSVTSLHRSQEHSSLSSKIKHRSAVRQTTKQPSAQGPTNLIDSVARPRTALDTRALPITPPSKGYPKQVWQPSYGINFSPPAIRPGLPPTPESLPHRVLNA